MPLDPVKLAEVRGWIHKSREDLDAVELLLRAAPPRTAVAVYHCQQAAEKALKGFLAWQGIPFRKTHSLEEIGEQCLRIDVTLKPTVDRAVPLTEYVWRFRYPGDPSDPPPAEAEEAFATARLVCAEVLSRLPKEAATS